MFNPAAYTFFSIIALFVFIHCYQIYRQNKRRTHINTFPFPAHCLQKLKQRYPDLSDAQIHDVELGLRQFFHTWRNSEFKFIAMPSQVVDELWHEFILSTREYAQFCDQAFGRFLHHHPSGTMQASNKTMNEGLRRCWWHACKIEHIDPANPTRLPTLFELDARLNICDGFHYAIKPVLPAAASSPNASAPAVSADQGRASLLMASLALTLLPVAAFADSSIDGSLAGFGPKGKPGGCGGSGCGGGDGGCGCGGCGGG